MTHSPIAQFFWALVWIGVPFVLANVVTKLVLDAPELKDLRNPFKAAVLIAAYWMFVQTVERRPVFELSRAGALRELTAGWLWSTGLIGLVVATLAVLGYYQVSGWSSGHGMLQMLQLHLFVAVLEEVLFRGVLFRLLEKILGTWLALVLSTALFGLAHLANPGASAMTLSCLGVFSVCSTLAFLVTRRLWLCIGMHWAWNFVQGGIFSLPVSGTQVWPGALAASAQGPAWATGGPFGLEASAFTLVLTIALCGLFAHMARARQHWVRPMWA